MRRQRPAHLVEPANCNDMIWSMIGQSVEDIVPRLSPCTNAAGLRIHLRKHVLPDAFILGYQRYRINQANRLLA